MAQQPFRTGRVPGDLDLVAVTDEGLGNTSWVVRLDGDVVVVDPERDPEPYLAAADQLGRPVGLVADTHLHADFLTGALELEALGAEAVVPAAGGYRWGRRPVQPGDEVDLGRWRLRALATPGHTPEHLAYLLTEHGRPRAVFTGGALLVGAVARTDLVEPASTQELTRALWRSVNREILSLPDDVPVLPTHGAGSFCSAGGGSRRWTTVGEERRANPLLQAGDEDRFVRAVLDGLGSYPPYFLRLRQLNRLGPQVVGALPLLGRLGAGEAEDLLARGAVLVDVRPVADYAAGHVPGSLAVALRPQLGSWLGWLVGDPATPLVFVVDDHTDERELVRQCLNIGYENLAGTVTIDTWRAAGGAVAATALLAPEAAAGRTVVDVRQAAEVATGTVPGAVHVELGSLPAAAAATTTTTGAAFGGLLDRPLLLMCGHGERAATAASILEAAGAADLAVLDGGPADWAAAHDGALAG